MPDSPTLPDSDPDLDLVHRVRGGDTQLFELLMRRHNQRLFRVARVFAANANEAEDIMQDAYVRAFTALDRFEERARFSTWLTRIAINEGLARCKRRRRSDRPGPLRLPSAALRPRGRPRDAATPVVTPTLTEP